VVVSFYQTILTFIHVFDPFLKGGPNLGWLEVNIFCRILFVGSWVKLTEQVYHSVRDWWFNIYELKHNKGLSSSSLKHTVLLHQQKILIISGFSKLWLPRYLKNVQNETIKRFLVGNTKINILTNQG